MKKKALGLLALAGVAIMAAGCGSKNPYAKYVTIGEYTGIEYVPQSVEVTDEDVQSEIDHFVEGLATKEEVTDRGIKEGDIANIDYEGKFDGEPFEGGSNQGHDLEIGSGSFIPGFEDALIGVKTGETKDISVVFPEQYEQKPEYAGKEAIFTVKVNSISVEKTPKLTDELVAENTEYETIDAYKQSIRDNLTKQAENAAENKKKSDVIQAIVEKATITGYPEEEVKELADEELENSKQQAQAYGMEFAEYCEYFGYTEDSYYEEIQNYVKTTLDQKMVILAIADKEKLKVSKEEIDAFLQEAVDSGVGFQSVDEIRESFTEEELEYFALNDKVTKFVVEKAVAVDELSTTEEASDVEIEATEVEGATAVSKEE